MSQGLAAPVTVAERIGALDVLRGVAVCGILLMNIPLMGGLWDLGRPLLPAKPDADWIAYTIQSVGFAGSMRGLFTLLFGAGMLVMLRHAYETTSAPAQAYLTRCFGLMLLGVANFAIFLWPGEILFNYGVCGLLLLLFWKAELRLLLTASAALLVTLTVFLSFNMGPPIVKLEAGQAAAAAQAAGKTLNEEQKAALGVWEKFKAHAHPTPEVIAKERTERTTFPSVLAWSARQWAKFNLSAVALGFMAESLAVMLIGMALFRLNVLSGERSLRFYLGLAAVGYGFGLTVRGAIAAWQWRTGFEPNPAVFDAFGWTYELGRVPTTLGLVGLVLSVYKLGALRWVEGGLSAIGRLALTNYIGQSIITSILFYGLGYWNRFGFAQLMGICAIIWVAQAIFSLLWLRRWQMGPAEWLLRSLTYGQWRRLERAEPAPRSLPLAAE